MMDLYIEGERVDLAPDAVFAVTVQSNDITKPDTVQSSYSNSLSAPFTERNHRILENAAEVNSMTMTPYRKLEATVLSDGVEVVPLPRVFVNEANEGYELRVFSGALDLFARFGDKSIRDLDLSRFNHVWNAENVVAGAAAGRTYQDGYIYPALDYGKPGRWAEDMHPAVFVRTIFEQMLAEAGVKYTGIEDELWDRLILPFSNDKPVHTPEWVEQHHKTNDLLVGIAGLPMNYGKAKVTIKLQIERVTKMWESGVAIVVMRKTPQGYFEHTMHAEYSAIAAKGEFELTATLEIPSHEDISNYIWSLSLNNVEEFSTDDPGRTWFSAGTYTVEYEDEVYFNTDWNVALNLPDIKQKDFFKAVRALFDLMPQFDPYSNTLTLTPFNKLLELNKLLERKPQALDWSRKLVYLRGQERVPVQYRFGSFAQRSWWRYKEDELGGDGDAYLAVDDEQLEREKDLVTLPFAASEDGSIPLFEPVREKPEYTKTTKSIASRNSSSFDDRDMVLVENASEDPHVRYGWAVYERIEDREYVTDGWRLVTQQHTFKRNKVEPRIAVLSEGPIPLDIATGKDQVASVQGRGSSFAPISFASLLPTRYKALQGVLNRTKGITPWFLLDPADVANYDPSVPIWLDQFQEYFYLNQITEFTGDGPTECQLWRL